MCYICAMANSTRVKVQLRLPAPQARWLRIEARRRMVSQTFLVERLIEDMMTEDAGR